MEHVMRCSGSWTPGPAHRRRKAVLYAASAVMLLVGSLWTSKPQMETNTNTMPTNAEQTKHHVVAAPVLFDQTNSLQLLLPAVRGLPGRH
eukprot:868486-Prymnesium_polylepis.1